MDTPSSVDLLHAEEKSVNIEQNESSVVIASDNSPVTVEDVNIENIKTENQVLLDSISPSTTTDFRSEPSNKIRVWKAKSGANLKSVLTEWSKQENVLLQWDTEEKYRLDYDVFISGTFESAIDVLLSRGLKDSPDYEIGIDPYAISIKKSD